MSDRCQKVKIKSTLVTQESVNQCKMCLKGVMVNHVWSFVSGQGCHLDLIKLTNYLDQSVCQLEMSFHGDIHSN